MPEPIVVHEVAISHVSDASGLTRLIDAGAVEADRVIAIVGKTEGNGGVNDYTRIIADRAFREVLIANGTRTAHEVRDVPIVWSGGTDGVLSPHATIFATEPGERVEPSDEPRLTVGFAMSETLGQRLPQMRGQPGRHGPGTAQRDARRLRRALAPPDQGMRRRRDRRGHR